MTWLIFLGLAAIIVSAGRYLAIYGDMLAGRTGMGRTWIGLVLVAATTSLPELFTGIGSTAVFEVPDIAVGDVLGSCMFNLLILSMMDAVGGEVPLSRRMSHGHSLSIGFGVILMGMTGLSLAAGARLPVSGWIGFSTPVLMLVYLLAMRVSFHHEQRLQAQAAQVAEELTPDALPLRTIWLRYGAAAAVVVGAALFLPRVGEAIAIETGLEQGFVGTLFIAIATSLPEVAVSLAAMRMGSVDLAVGNVLGSNLFNIFILGIDDLFYRPGALLATVGSNHLIAVLAVLAMYGIALVGLTYQAEKKRTLLAWDTLAIAGFYAVTIVMYLAM